MSDSAADPSGSTEQFKAFVHQAPAGAPARSNTALIVGVAVGAVVLVALVVAVFML
mgnify:FL=1